MADEWFYTQNGQQCGPVDFSQLQGHGGRRVIHPSDLIWKQGMPNWAAASTVPGVFPSRPPPPMPPAPDTRRSSPTTTAGIPPAPAPFPDHNPRDNGSIFPGTVGMAVTALFFPSSDLSHVWGVFSRLARDYFRGHRILRQSETGDNRGQGMAVAGLIIGIIDICFGITAC